MVKCAREEAVSDDEVEVVEEWTLPMTGSSATTTDPCSPSHIPVIQRPTDHTLPAKDGDEDSVRREASSRMLLLGVHLDMYAGHLNSTWLNGYRNSI